ncbi:MAG: xly 5 [Verrucomicrobiales bacterium]|nr:xly 5 [Verrucomicrobiales bacterium]
MNRIVAGLFVVASAFGLSAAQAPIFIEAESFADHGGWSLDTQFVVGMGSSYLLAHGVGKPVVDAKTKFTAPEAGSYHVWVRTKDWVAPWKAPGTPGRFQLMVNGKALATEFGTKGAEWHWQEGGAIDLAAGETTLALHDLTGFDGRCDAILLSADASYRPPEGAALAEARRGWLNLPSGPEDAGDYDLVVVGGGYSGMGAAISAARQSLKVAFIQDRFVLGGNGSSEIRVWANGGTMRGKYPHLGEIVEEFADHAPDCPADPEFFGADVKEQVCRREKTMSLFLGHFVRTAEMDSATGRIRSITALDVRTGRERRFRGKFFVDCTGHGELGAQAGAKYSMAPKGRMGMSNLWFYQEEEGPQTWPETPWALPLEMGDFPAQKKSKSVIDGKPFMKAEWFWESGFDQDPIKGAELVRDWNLRAAFGAFSALKTGADKPKHVNSALKWVAYVGGPRESRLLEGDVILSREDIISQRDFPDGCVATTWDIDLHYPKEQYAKKFPENPFISRAEFGAGVDKKDGYPVPYRCFYSTNVPNLFMAGRCVSVTHQALGTIRVMRTCGMMGEVVGKAAYVCVAKNVDPRGVYEKHLPLLLELISEPGAMRRDSIAGKLQRDPHIADVAPFFQKGSDPLSIAAGKRPATAATNKVVSLDIPGILVDETAAAFRGTWTRGDNLRPFIGDGYRYSKSANGEAKYSFTVPKNGRYELRLSWVDDPNRATQVPCKIERGTETLLKLRLNQRSSKADAKGFHSLGVFEFQPGIENAVTLSTSGTDGYVHADCLQIVEAKH